MNRYLIDRLMNDRNRDYRRDRRYDYDDEDDEDRRSDRAYSRGGSRGSQGRGNQGRGGQGRDNRGQGRGNYGGGRDRGYDDYDDEMDFEYNKSQDFELPKSALKKWEKDLKNADGTKGPKFDKDQVIPIAEQHGVKFDKFTEEEFLCTVNMLYSDFCDAVREMGVPNYLKPEPYIHLAKAFLCDDDFDGEPYEKLAAYYYGVHEFDK